MCGHGAGWALECPYPHPYPFKFTGNYPCPCPCPYPTMQVFIRSSWIFLWVPSGLRSNCHPYLLLTNNLNLSFQTSLN